MNPRTHSTRERFGFFMATFASTYLGVLCIHLTPLLKTALIDNSAITMLAVGRYRLAAAFMISIVSTIVSEWGGYPSSDSAYYRALRNAFVRGISIFAVLERLMT